AQGANNCFGMKRSLSGNTWAGSTWDGKSIYTKKTQEDDGRGNLYYITADFRKYPCVEDSIADHSAYLLGAKNGNSLRYAGLKGCTDYKKAIQIIKDGGYATDTKYVSKICEIIERWNLTQFDVKEGGESRQEETIPAKYPDRPIIDITKENLSEVPRNRGSNKIQFIVVHYLGVPNADNPYLYGGGYGGHYNIKRDGSVYKAADPKAAVVWHCGGGLQGSGGHTFHGICTNYNSIGIECGACYTDTSVKEASGDSNQWYFTTETQESLVWLVAKLMKEYGVSIDHVIRHYDVTGKCCPNPYVKNNKLRTSWTWDEFITKVEAQVSGKASDSEKKETTVLDEKHAKYINSTSTHYISNSGSDENGGARGGSAGDQTGKEWQMRAWYNRPWSCVLRYPDQKVALKIATLGVDAALNDKIGYDQNQRDTYWQQLKAAGYDPSRISTPCEEDCSAGVCANVRAAGYIFGIKTLQEHRGTYTGDMRSAFKAAGFKVLTEAKYLSSPDYLLPGDILLNEAHHTATNVTVGSKARSEWKPGTSAPV
ncbi:MAG: N-acetylmuramoyl-L-alanine amidase, partial [Eubacterium sp.]|nr:N-acetylmuramoyl-L-alanine amidase [Eubacterium sp.]